MLYVMRKVVRILTHQTFLKAFVLQPMKGISCDTSTHIIWSSKLKTKLTYQLMLIMGQLRWLEVLWPISYIGHNLYIWLLMEISLCWSWDSCAWPICFTGCDLYSNEETAELLDLDLIDANSLKGTPLLLSGPWQDNFSHVLFGNLFTVHMQAIFFIIYLIYKSHYLLLYTNINIIYLLLLCYKGLGEVEKKGTIGFVEKSKIFKKKFLAAFVYILKCSKIVISL